MSLIAVENLEKHYESAAVAGVSLALAKGEILCLLGPSGCGKTTLLRLISGLEKPDAGKVLFNGKDVTRVPSHLRHFGLMFQEFALFPHKSVFDNVAFGLRMQQLPSVRIRKRTVEMLELVGLARMSDRNVADLSGGERQRVALARSLAPRPRLLMLDEPLGALDRALRERLLVDIRAILKHLGTTAIFVTHDQAEALAVADRVAVMDGGRLLQVAPPEILYRYPANVGVARFLGFENLLDGQTTDDGGVDTALGRLYPAASPAGGMAPRTAVTVVLRPESAQLGGDSENRLRTGRISGRVVSRVFNGQTYRIGIDTDAAARLVFDLPNEAVPPDTGQEIALTLKPTGIAVIPPS